MKAIDRLPGFHGRQTREFDFVFVDRHDTMRIEYDLVATCEKSTNEVDKIRIDSVSVFIGGMPTTKVCRVGGTEFDCGKPSAEFCKAVLDYNEEEIQELCNAELAALESARKD